VFKDSCVLGSVCEPNIKTLAFSGVFVRHIQRLLRYLESVRDKYKDSCVLRRVCAPNIKKYYFLECAPNVKITILGMYV
jgi:hypothetical protein